VLNNGTLPIPGTATRRMEDWIRDLQANGFPPAAVRTCAQYGSSSLAKRRDLPPPACPVNSFRIEALARRRLSRLEIEATKPAASATPRSFASMPSKPRCLRSSVASAPSPAVGGTDPQEADERPACCSARSILYHIDIERTCRTAPATLHRPDGVYLASFIKCAVATGAAGKRAS